MRTNVVLDDKIVKQAFRFSQAKTKKDLLHEALIFMINHKKRKNLQELKGKLTFRKNYNHKTLR